MEKWVIKDHELTYDDKTHSYFCDGKKCISVTQLIHFQFPDKYKDVDEAVLKNAAKKGNELHNAIEVYEKYGLESEYLKEFRNYLFLKVKHNFIVVNNEIPIILPYKDIFICGRLDLVLQENNELGLGDIKRTSVLDKQYLAYQLNLYRLGYMFSYEKTPKFLKALHLRNDVRKYLEIPINEQFAFDLMEEFYERKIKDEFSSVNR